VGMLRSMDDGAESAFSTFERDHLAITAASGESGEATLRFWRSDAERVSIGRFHRRPAGSAGLVRRLTGGRALYTGPGISSATMVLPALAWLDRGRGVPAPEQVLNRALRPWLAAFRDFGVDAFYGGRDLVTWERRPVAGASFTTLPDGIVVVDVHVAVAAPFSRVTELLATFDPTGLVPHDASPFRDTGCLRDRLPGFVEAEWRATVTRHLASALGVQSKADERGTVATLGFTVERAFEAFQCEREELLPGWRSALGIEMLGAVEVAARIESGRIAALELYGDVIAPFSTLEEIGYACVGEAATRAAADRALLGVLTRPGRFLLGVRDFGALVERLA
jgi:hypothetical protein